ncbi:MAG: 30S ribosomal protein S1 [Rickettsiales bacterium]
MAKLSKSKYRLNSQIIEDFKTNEVFADLLESSTTRSIKEGELTQGEIIRLDNEYATIDVGAKNEGQISFREFIFDGVMPELKVGDKVEVYVEKIESRSGKTILSREKAVREKYWVVLESALEKTETINGTIFGKVKGGYTVDLNGIVAFLPGSQVDIRPIKDITPLMGISQPFIILKIDREQGNVVVSRRAILEGSREEARHELLASIKENQILEGVVKNITDYGAFIDLGSVDGLLHVTDISWGRINHPSEVLTLGQVIKVQVIKYNEDSKRISLGMKQLESNPWQSIEGKYPKGSKMSGKVTNITDYGVFIELEPGIEGLVHISEVSWTKNNVHPKKFVHVGQEVDFVIIDIDASKHRISLGMKQCINNPWASFADKYPLNSVVEGEIKNIVDFGLFVGFDNDVDGLVHLSDLSWEEDNADKLKQYQKEQKVLVKVLAIDVDKERISLGIKQLTEDTGASTKANSAFKKGQVVSGKITEILEDSLTLELADEFVGTVKKADFSADKHNQSSDLFKVGEVVEAKVVSVDNSNKKATLSIKAAEAEEHKKAMAEYTTNDSSASSSSLGDILGKALNNKS